MFKIDLKKMVLLSQVYYKVGKDKGSIFFQSLSQCEVAILHFAFLYSWVEKMATSFLAVEI